MRSFITQPWWWHTIRVERSKNAHKRRMQIPSRLKTCLAMADTSHIVSGIHAKSVVTAKHVVVTRHSQNCGHKRGAYQRQFTKLCTKCRPNTPQKVPTPSLYRWTINEPSMNHMHLPKTTLHRMYFGQYRIVGNFRGRKLLHFGGNQIFAEELSWIAHWCRCQKMPHPQFCGENFHE